MKIKNLLAVLMLMAVTSFSFAQISGTLHDMSGAGWNTAATNKLCGVCHTPHNSLTIQDAPLWSHDTSVAAYTMYTSAVSSTFDATPGTAPDGNSKLCLSCHDGTVALDNFIPVNTSTTFLVGSALLDVDLSNDHPISFVYDAALVALDGELHPVTDPSTLGGTINQDLLFNTKMQCASCHDVHDDTNNPFLLMVNTNSELCLVCHVK